MSKVGVAKTPEGLEPVTYLGQDVMLCDWSARLWSLCCFGWGSRPLCKVPMTVGFAQGVTAVHEKLAQFAKNKRPVTAKPFLCISSRGDDVLKAPETLSRADASCDPAKSNSFDLCCAHLSYFYSPNLLRSGSVPVDGRLNSMTMVMMCS